MTDDEAPIVANDIAIARAYDYFKHLTTVALISIGGVFGLLQGDGPRLKTTAVILVIALIGLAGGISLIAISSITAADLQGKSLEKLRKSILRTQQIATFLLLFGLGVFIGAFTKVMQ